MAAMVVAPASTGPGPGDTFAGAAVGAVAGGVATAAIGFVIAPGARVPLAGLGLAAGGVGGGVAGAATTLWGPSAGIGASVLPPVALALLAATAGRGSAGMAMIGAILVGAPYMLGGLIGTAAASQSS